MQNTTHPNKKKITLTSKRWIIESKLLFGVLGILLHQVLACKQTHNQKREMLLTICAA